MQLPLFEPSFWTVSDITRYIREMFDDDANLQDIWVQGEVSNFSRPTSGHVYFTLKDAACQLRCVMWKNSANRQLYLPRNGEAVEVHGAVTVFEAGGQYQIYADAIRPAGEGMLYKEFLRLKALLEAEGLFDAARKRTIPAWPRRIGIVTSPTGAALRDMLKTMKRRYPVVEVVLSPCPVQGIEAPSGIVKALELLNRIACPDVILLARGGGSIEDLWAFNDERVARAVSASAAPVISGVGHETDYTICDFVCDLRAPTPTAAAELATPNQVDLLADLSECQRRIDQSLQSKLDEDHWKVKHLSGRLSRQSPQSRIQNDLQLLDLSSRRMGVAAQHRLRLQNVKLTAAQQRLNSLNPIAILERGFAVVSLGDGEVVRSVSQVAPGAALNVRVADGQFEARAGENGAKPGKVGKS